MRSTILGVCLAFLLMAGTAQARETGFSFGVRGQVTANWFTGGLGDAFDDMTTGWGGGLVFEWQVSETFGLGVGTLYSRVEADGLFDIDPDEVESDLRIEWIEIPVYAKLGGPMHLVAGVTSRFQISSTFGDDESLVVFEDGFEDAEYSALIGVGYDMTLGETVLQFGADFQLGLSDTVDVEDLSGRVNTLVLRAAILF